MIYVPPPEPPRGEFLDKIYYAMVAALLFCAMMVMLIGMLAL
jgi:hypothetical protein